MSFEKNNSKPPQSRKKVVLISPVFQDKSKYTFKGLTNGGGGRYVSELALSISQYLDTTLVTFGESDYEFKHEGLQIRIIKCKPFLRKFNGDGDFLCLRLISILKDFDIIHSFQYYTETTLFSCLVSKIFKKKLFITDLGFRGINISRYIPMKYFCTKLLLLSDYEAKLYRMRQGSYEVIGGGVNLKKYHYGRHKKNKVIFIGRLLPHKGVNYLIQSLDNNTECIISGFKQDFRYFELLKSLANGKKVKFLLSASDKEIAKHLRESAALVLPSVDVDIYGKSHKNTELFGLVIAEAFACGTPVIVSNSSALPYVVDDGINGFVVNQNDPVSISKKIMILVQNIEKSTAMGLSAYNKAVSRYNWEYVAQRCVANYTNNI